MGDMRIMVSDSVEDTSDVEPASRPLPETKTRNHVLEGVLNIITAAPNAGSLGELNDLFRPSLSELGYNVVAAIRLAKPEGRVHVRALFGEGFEPWLTHYRNMNYAAEDSVLEKCFWTHHSFFWSEMLAREELSPTSIRILNEARTFGLLDCFITPLRKPDASILIILFAGKPLDTADPFFRTASQLLASCYAIAGTRLHAMNAPAGPALLGLTLRQIECLKWILKGKSSRDIAAIMGISARVVDDHVKRACQRLGVRTRAQAVHAASNLGYLDT